MPKKKPAPKPQQSVQLSAVTRKQMRELARLWGMPETRHTTAVNRRAVEYAHAHLIGKKETKMATKQILITCTTDWGGWDYGDSDPASVHAAYRRELAKLVANEFPGSQVIVNEGDEGPDKYHFWGFPEDFDEDVAIREIERIGSDLATEDVIYA